MVEALDWKHGWTSVGPVEPGLVFKTSLLYCAFLRQMIISEWYICLHYVSSACFASTILDWAVLCRFCGGKGCGRCYHLSCLKPPLVDAPIGVWHCHFCVRRKIFDIYSVSEGVESVCDAKEVPCSNVDGTNNNKSLFYFHGWFPYYFESTWNSSVFFLGYCQYMVHILVSGINCLLCGICFRIYCSERISSEI